MLHLGVDDGRGEVSRLMIPERIYDGCDMFCTRHTVVYGIPLRLIIVLDDLLIAECLSLTALDLLSTVCAPVCVSA